MKAGAERAKSLRLSALFFTLLRIFLGLLFLLAGTHKASDPGNFLVAIRSFEVLADPWAPLVALCLPWLEILTGFCLIIHRCYHAALLLAGGLLTLFLPAILYAWARGLQIECGCFGPGSATTDPLYLLTRDLALLLGIASLAWHALYNDSDRTAAA